MKGLRFKISKLHQLWEILSYNFVRLAPELDVPVAAGGDGEVGVSCDGGEGDDVAVHEALLIVVRVRQVGKVQLLELKHLKEECCDGIDSSFVRLNLLFDVNANTSLIILGAPLISHQIASNIPICIQ